MRQTPEIPRYASLHRRRILRLAWWLPLAAIGAGCGQKGPLYHPPESEDDEDGDKDDDETSAVPGTPGSRLA